MQIDTPRSVILPISSTSIPFCLKKPPPFCRRLAGRGDDRRAPVAPSKTRASGEVRRLRIDDDPEGISSPDEAAGQLRVVLQDGARPDEDRVMEAPQPVGETERRGGADPAGMAGGGGDPAVEGLGELQGDEGDAGPDVFEEDLVLPSARLFQDSRLSFRSRGVCRAAMPLPETRGLGSIVPTTTRPGRQAIRASTQGGVFP